ncbi:MAG: FIST N-terminal domain-containing protein [Gaiellales bacterium]
MIRAGAGVSTKPESGAAAADAVAQARAGLGGAGVDLALVFLSPHHLPVGPLAAIAEVRDGLDPGCLVGCVSQGVIGGEREVEDGPGVAVWAASLPGGTVTPFRVGGEDDDEDEDELALPELGEPSLVVLLVDPFSVRTDDVVAELDGAYPGVPVVGGIATGGGRPGLQALIVDGTLASSGAVGVALSGVPVQAVVSQGCAPLGPESVITSADGNLILELAGRPAYERLRDVIAGLSPRERDLAARGLLAGIVIDENRPAYERGDFLMRGIIGVDEESGALAVGEDVRVGQTIRFHARDAASADEDLRLALTQTLGPGERPAGALLFTCNGRGTRMFEGPDHDSRAVVSALGSPAVSGFFCGGEIGPVGGRSFLHGFTATMAIFLDGG